MGGSRLNSTRTAKNKAPTMATVFQRNLKLSWSSSSGTRFKMRLNFSDSRWSGKIDLPDACRAGGDDVLADEAEDGSCRCWCCGGGGGMAATALA